MVAAFFLLLLPFFAHEIVQYWLNHFAIHRHTPFIYVCIQVFSKYMWVFLSLRRFFLFVFLIFCCCHLFSFSLFLFVYVCDSGLLTCKHTHPHTHLYTVCLAIQLGKYFPFTFSFFSFFISLTIYFIFLAVVQTGSLLLALYGRIQKRCRTISM